jgi:hypothetical protein
LAMISGPMPAASPMVMRKGKKLDMGQAGLSMSMN